MHGLGAGRPTAPAATASSDGRASARGSDDDSPLHLPDCQAWPVPCALTVAPLPSRTPTPAHRHTRAHPRTHTPIHTARASTDEPAWLPVSHS